MNHIKIHIWGIAIKIDSEGTEITYLYKNNYIQ